MKRFRSIATVLMMAALVAVLCAGCSKKQASTGPQAKKIAYLSPSTAETFWVFLEKGVEEQCKKYGYEFTVYDSKEEPSTQLKNAQNALVRGADGIIISPADSASCPAVLAEAQKAGVPVVIADVGTESGEYLSFVNTPNEEGAYAVGKVLADYIVKNNLQRGPIGEISIPLARLNGQLRQKGFKRAMDEQGIRMGPTLQMNTFTLEESGTFTQNLLTGSPDMVAIWVHSNAQTNGVLRALEARGLNKKVLVVNFDGDEGVVAAIKAGNILVCGAQQPLEMGRKSVDALKTFFDGGTPPKSIPIPVLMLSQDNIGEMEAEAKRTVYLEENQL